MPNGSRMPCIVVTLEEDSAPGSSASGLTGARAHHPGRCVQTGVAYAGPVVFFYDCPSEDVLLPLPSFFSFLLHADSFARQPSLHTTTATTATRKMAQEQQQQSASADDNTSRLLFVPAPPPPPLRPPPPPPQQPPFLSGPARLPPTGHASTVAPSPSPPPPPVSPRGRPFVSLERPISLNRRRNGRDETPAPRPRAHRRPHGQIVIPRSLLDSPPAASTDREP